jgi:hypothetical protein
MGTRTHTQAGVDNVTRIRPDAPAPDTVTVVCRFGPDEIDVAGVFAELYERLGPRRDAGAGCSDPPRPAAGHGRRGMSAPEGVRAATSPRIRRWPIRAASSCSPRTPAQVSFRIGADGHVTEDARWHHAGPLPADIRHWTNAPPNPLAVHTAWIEDTGPA